MVACIFPTAIFQAKAADESMMASVVLDDAVGTINSQVRYSRLSSQPLLVGDANANSPLIRQQAVGPTFEPLLLSPDPNNIHKGIDLDPNAAKYANSPVVRNYGWVALARQMPGPGNPGQLQNDYQFIIVPYAVPRGQATPILYKAAGATITIAADGTATIPAQPVLGASPIIPAGSPVILENPSGLFAFAVGRTPGGGGDTGAYDDRLAIVVLSNSLGAPAGIPRTLTNCTVWYCLPNPSLPGWSAADKSPAIGCLVYRTALKP